MRIPAFPVKSDKSKAESTPLIKFKRKDLRVWSVSSAVISNIKSSFVVNIATLKPREM